MSTKANPKVIGAFVLGGIALAAAGIIAFGGTLWFRTLNTIVAYFPGSVQGLRVGANVSFRGVPIGQVTDIRILFNPDTLETHIPVVFQLDPDKIVDVGGPGGLEQEGFNKELVDKGFRAQLGLDSIVTGMLSVNLDFFANAPAPTFRNAGAFALPYPEIPTMQSDLEKLQASAGEIAQQLTAALNTLNGVLGDLRDEAGNKSGAIGQIIDDIANFTDSLNAARPRLEQLVEDAGAAAGAISSTAATVQTILQENDDNISQALAELRDSLTALRRMADQLNNMAAENREGLRDFTQTGLYEVTGLAQDMQRMVDQITRVMEDFERDPARFLFGDRTGGIRAE